MIIKEMKASCNGVSYSCFLLTLALLLFSVPDASTQDIRMPPSLTKDSSTLIYYEEGSNVTLFCEGIGSPSLLYEWTKNGQPLNANTGNIQMRSGVGTIDIAPCLASDEGYYQCHLSNIYGGTMSNTTFLQMAFLESFTPDPYPGGMDIYLNDYAHMACYPYLRGVPESEFFWTYNFSGNAGPPVEVVQDSRIQTDPYSGALYLMDAKAEDGDKIYACNVKNPFLQTFETMNGLHLRVSPYTTPSYGPTSGFSTPSDMVVLEGEPMVIRCFHCASPMPTITWTKDNQDIPQDRWSVTHDGSGLTLTSGRLAQEDAGYYRCVTFNGYGNIGHGTTLEIAARPVFLGDDYQPHDVNATDLEDVVISCNPYAIPNATIRWFKNRVEFTSTSLPPKMSLSSDLKNLTINSVCKSCYEGGSGDLMTIQCNASNAHGHAFAQGYVNVLLRTVITSAGGSRPWIAYQNEVFDCEATSDGSTPVTLHWIYNGSAVQESEKIFVAANGSLVILTQNDTDGGRYRQGEYICVASNGFSQAEVIYAYGELPIKLIITAKSTLYDLFIDGIPVPRSLCDKVPDEVTLQRYNQLIAVTAIDTTATCAGILASTTEDILLSNAEWKCTATPAPGWYTLGFNDAGWSDAHIIGLNHNVTWPEECSSSLKGFDSISENASWIWTSSISQTPLYDYTIYCRAYLYTCDEPEPICLNGGICNKNNATLCTCLPGYSGSFCENEELERSLSITAKSVIYELFIDEIRQNLTHNDDWETADVIRLSLANRLITLLAADSTETCAGILASVTDDYLVTDSTWKCHVGPPPGWNDFDFDDSDWAPAYVIGPNGNVTLPEKCVFLKEIPTISHNANWIWTSTVNSAEDYDHAIYCRAYLPYCETVRPCRNGGTCNRNSKALCSCPEGFTGIYCESVI